MEPVYPSRARATESRDCASVSAGGRDWLQRARVPPDGRRALSAARPQRLDPVASGDRDDRLCGQRRGDHPSWPRVGDRRGGAISGRTASADLHLRGAGGPAGTRHATPARRAARPLDRGAGHVRVLGPPSQWLPAGRRALMGGRAPRPPRLRAAGVRHPVSGLPICLGRFVPQAGPLLTGGGRSFVWNDRDLWRAIIGVRDLHARRPVAGRRSRLPVGRCGTPLSGHQAHRGVVRRCRGARATRLWRPADHDLQTRADARRCTVLARRCLCPARAGAERPIRQVAGMRTG